MKSLFFTTLLLVIGLGTKAYAFEDVASAREASTAVIRCAAEAQKLLSFPGSYLGDVTLELNRVSEGVITRSYLFKGLIGGNAFGPRAKTIATLLVVETISQADRRMDAPASVSWACHIQ